jgi:hypothetical protein
MTTNPNPRGGKRLKYYLIKLISYLPLIMIVLMVELNLFSWRWGILVYLMVSLSFPLARYLRRREDYNMMIRTGIMDPIETMICGRPFRFIEGGPKARWKAMRSIKRKYKRSNDETEKHATSGNQPTQE